MQVRRPTASGRAAQGEAAGAVGGTSAGIAAVAPASSRALSGASSSMEAAALVRISILVAGGKAPARANSQAASRTQAPSSCRGIASGVRRRPAGFQMSPSVKGIDGRGESGRQAPVRRDGNVLVLGSGTRLVSTSIVRASLRVCPT